jgi:hypothetical protein
MSGVFQNIDPPTPHRPAGVPPRLWCGGRTHSLGGEGVGAQYFWKTPDTALYSKYVTTLCSEPTTTYLYSVQSYNKISIHLHVYVHVIGTGLTFFGGNFTMIRTENDR